MTVVDQPHQRSSHQTPRRILTLPWLKPRDSCELGLLGFRRYV